MPVGLPGESVALFHDLAIMQHFSPVRENPLRYSLANQYRNGSRRREPLRYWLAVDYCNACGSYGRSNRCVIRARIVQRLLLVRIAGRPATSPGDAAGLMQRMIASWAGSRPRTCRAWLPAWHQDGIPPQCTALPVGFRQCPHLAPGQRFRGIRAAANRWQVFPASARRPVAGDRQVCAGKRMVAVDRAVGASGVRKSAPAGGLGACRLSPGRAARRRPRPESPGWVGVRISACAGVPARWRSPMPPPGSR